jgi:hypothetical protein
MRPSHAAGTVGTALLLATVACAGHRPGRRALTFVNQSTCQGAVDLTVYNHTSRDLQIIERTNVTQVVVGIVPPGVRSFTVKPSSATSYEALSADGTMEFARETIPPHFQSNRGKVLFERTCRPVTPA